MKIYLVTYLLTKCDAAMLVLHKLCHTGYSVMVMHVNKKKLAGNLNIHDLMREFVILCEIRKVTFKLV